MSPSVFDLAVAARALTALALATEDDRVGELDATIAAWVGAAAEKGEACAAAHRALTSEAAHWRAEAARLITLAKRAERAATRVHDLATELVRAAESLGGEGVRVGPLRMQANAGRVVIVDAAALPDGLVLIRREPDKAAIAARIKAGMDVPGAVIEPSRSIRGLS